MQRYDKRESNTVLNFILDGDDVHYSMTLAIKCQLPTETEGFQIYRNPKFIHDRILHQGHQYVRIEGPYSLRISTLACHELTSWNVQTLNFETLSSSGRGGKVSQINIGSYFRRVKSLSKAQRGLHILRFLHKTYDVFVKKSLCMRAPKNANIYHSM